MRVYLDNCCFNRPFDDQSQARVRLESEAKLEIQRNIKAKSIELAWSFLLDYENSANPYQERSDTIVLWKNEAVADVEETPAVLRDAHEIAGLGVRPNDALHIACAIAAGCDFFLTTDDSVLKRARGFTRIAVMNPTQFITEAMQ
jgi:predicted nucleic acid-binding protein